MRAEMLKTPVQRHSAQDARGDVVSVPTHSVTHERLGKGFWGTRRGDAINVPTYDVTHIGFTSGALIRVYRYLIVIRVRAGRLCSCHEPES
ncbi:hypothetical protein Sjap_012202 [Stephania japonica]|uniref:Uncharacterized protein n=1 Tax=Stephania japonica TaxID=461633 RepID=A0AAP0IWA6_9MAGN